MSPKTSRVTVDGEDTRGCCGCFGWFFRLFKKKRRGHRAKDKDAEPSLRPLATNAELLQHNNEEQDSVMAVAEITDVKVIDEVPSVAAAAEDVVEARQAELAQKEQEPRVVKTWAEEVDEAEEKGLDVFAPQTSFLLHTAAPHCETQTTPENEVTAAALTVRKTSAAQKRRARRKALAAALKASAEGEAISQNKAPEAAETVKTSAAQKRRARRKVLAAALKAPAEGEAASQNEAPEAATAETTCSVDSVAKVHGSKNATRRRRARRNACRKAAATRIMSEARPPDTNRAPVWPTPSVRVFRSDRRPFVTTWEEAAYSAFHQG